MSYQIVYRADTGESATCNVPNMDPIRRAEALGTLVKLPNGARIKPNAIVSVGRYDGDRLVAAWLVSAHGLDGTMENASVPSVPATFDWADAWKKIAALTQGVTRDDPRYALIVTCIDQAEAAWRAGDTKQFAANQAKLAALRLSQPGDIAAPA
jgi:hypothetical protein